MLISKIKINIKVVSMLRWKDQGPNQNRGMKVCKLILFFWIVRIRREGTRKFGIAGPSLMILRRLGRKSIELKIV